MKRSILLLGSGGLSIGALTAMEATQSFVAMLSTHIVFIVLLGIVLTWASHSSVAVVLLAMSLATKGALTVPAGIALALGANIGTAISPLVAGPASRITAKSPVRCPIEIITASAP